MAGVTAEHSQVNSRQSGNTALSVARGLPKKSKTVPLVQTLVPFGSTGWELTLKFPRQREKQEEKRMKEILQTRSKQKQN